MPVTLPIAEPPTLHAMDEAKRRVDCSEVVQMAQNPAAFAAAEEQAYHDRIEALCERTLRGGQHIVMLTGASAAGKTISAHKLSAALMARGRRSAVISLDDFYVGEGRYPKRADGTDDYECLESLDLPLLHRCLRDINESGCCTAPVFDFRAQLPCGTREVDCRDGVVIIEGLHALNPALCAPLPRAAVLRVYAGLREEYHGPDGTLRLNTRDIRLARRLIRDYRSRGHGVEFTFDLWDEVCEGERRYIAPYKPQADVLLDTSHRYEVCLWRRELATLPAHRPDAIRALGQLQREFALFPALGAELVPQGSMLREFIDPNQ